MTSIEEHLQKKREPLDKWSIREQLCLAVARMNDQNLAAVSRILKPFAEPNRPPDWFYQKNCAAQYGALLANVETPKRKKRTACIEVFETPAECVVRRLLNERKTQLITSLAEERTEYQQIQLDLQSLQSGNATEEQIEMWCKQIDEEERRTEEEAAAHIRWLREREIKKQELERNWRPTTQQQLPTVTGTVQKRTYIDCNDNADAVKSKEESSFIVTDNIIKPAQSPLLTSLLKSPTQSQQPPLKTGTISNASPTIASLLNSSASLTVSPGIQQLVTHAIGTQHLHSQHKHGNTGANVILPTGNDILSEQNYNHIKIDDIASSILEQSDDGPLPEIKNDVDGLISDLIDNAQDIVNDPEQHLQLDGNGDININLELDDLEEEENAKKSQDEISVTPIVASVVCNENKVDNARKQVHEMTVDQSKLTANVDPFEFREELEIYSPVINTKQYQQQSSSECEKMEEGPVKESHTSVRSKPEENDIKKSKEVDMDNGKAFCKHVTIAPIDSDGQKLPESIEKIPIISDENTVDVGLDDSNAVKLSSNSCGADMFDDTSIEVRIDKSGKIKRDYSRNSRKQLQREDKPFEVSFMDISCKREDANYLNANETLNQRSVDKEKATVSKIRNEHERSNSSWTEEDECISHRVKRRLSTPSDSVPNSPASSITVHGEVSIGDDRDYRNWKKSMMLVYNRLATNKYASLFLKPITDDQAPGYHNVVYRPMDLSTIRRNIENANIRNTQEFQRDAMLMLNNAIMYNTTNSTVYNMARQMQHDSLYQIRILLQAQEKADTPTRRETRTSESKTIEPASNRKRVAEDHTNNKYGKKRKED